jgi:transcriptional regulator with XRE-family HTH domain
MSQRERVEEAMERAGFKTQQAIAEACEVTQPAVNALLSGKFPMLDLLKKIADRTGVSYDWLRFGDLDKAPPWVSVRNLQGAGVARVQSPHEDYRAGGMPRLVEIVGQVVAGDGDLDKYEDLVESVEVPTNWKIVVVHGLSAYPVFYPEQLAWVDLDRAVTPSTMTEQQHIDLHDNVVVVQAEIAGRRIGLLKRYNYQPTNPLRFALTSLDGGRSSPYVAPESILVILPCVGSWWIDPRKPRKKLFHAKTVVPNIGP